jgi:N-acetylglucosamine malate deacetylase 1
VNVLVVAAHPDDEALGCGGAVLAHRADGDQVDVVFMTSGELGLGTYPVDEARHIREEEAANAAAVLGFGHVEFLRLPDGSLADDMRPLTSLVEGVDLVYVPHPGEGHADHAAVGRAAAELSGVDVLGYEIWTPIASPGFVVDISDLMDRKLEAIRSYKCQLEYWPYDRGLEGLNAYRGAMLQGVAYAEAFTVL